MRLPGTNSTSVDANHEVCARKTALLLLCDAHSAECACLGNLSLTAWQRLLHWLDTSGLALYFLDRVIELEQGSMLPSEILASLHRRLANNIARTQRMIDESAELHREFQRAGLCYAMLKGFSLWPHSVPKPELRSQLDLDFLVSEESATEARRILEAKGYHLHAVSGRSWEFKTREQPGRSLDSLYETTVCRSAELHVETHAGREASPLSRVRPICFRGVLIPVLSPADIFLGQGLHLFKHVCSEFSRTAHWLEFRRHVAARYGDSAFWSSVRSVAHANGRAEVALGLVTMLITRVTGAFAPDEFTGWTVEYLPEGARRWVDLYGEQAAFMSFPGNKLYLLLQSELAACGLQADRPRWRALLPTRLPPPVLLAAEQESLAARLYRYRTQAWFICFRLRFHVVHGLSYLRESIRWRLSTAGSAQ